MKDIGSEPEVRFGCPGCGKCCSTPPAILVDEIVEQANNFILGAQLRIISAIDPDDKRDQEILKKSYPELDTEDPSVRHSLAEHLNAIAQTQGVLVNEPISDGSAPYLAFSMIDVNQISGKCPQLGEDGCCKIYNSRPLKCRSVPIDETVPEALLGDSLQHEINNMIRRGGKCDISSDAPVIWQSGHLVEEEDREVHRSGGVGMSEKTRLFSKEIVEEYLSFKASESGLEINTVANTIEHLGVDRMRPIFAIVPAVARLIRSGGIATEVGAEILLKQAALIEERLPSVGPDDPVEGIMNADMRTVLRDWKSMYEHIGRAWKG